MRSLSSAMRAAIHASETSEVILVLLTLSHPDIFTQRFVNNNANIVSRGETYVAYPFDITLPDDRDDEAVRVRLSIDNVDRSLVLAVRSINSRPPTFTIEVIRAAAPDVVEVGPFRCSLHNAEWDQFVVSGELAYEDTQNEPFPRFKYTPDRFPGLFR